MTNLTDKWKKGELPEGWYWVEGSRAEGIYAYTAEYLNNIYRPKNSDRIIEQVPSYDGFMTVVRAYDGVVEENTKLKELLKEVLRHDLSLKEVTELTRKISQVLGEE